MATLSDPDFQTKALSTLCALKSAMATQPVIIPVEQGGKVIGRLRLLTKNLASEEIRLLTEWRNQHRAAFFTWFLATDESTRRWVQAQILSRDDRLLFFVETVAGKPVGHLGLTNFDFVGSSCEMDNVLRGDVEWLKGGMTFALRALLAWVFGLGARRVFLRVFGDNRRAVEYYSRNGFLEFKRVPLRRIEEENRVRWVEAAGGAGRAFEKEVLYMEIQRSDFEGGR